MNYRIEVYWRGQTDGRAVDLLSQIAHLGLDRVEQAQVSNLYFLRGTPAPEALDRLAVELLADPVVEGFRWRLARRWCLRVSAASSTNVSRATIDTIRNKPGPMPKPLTRRDSL
jgi:phosphoribosylformylglycinamidine (FGAM) synthase PurS component